jgi:hypothetical protein
MVACSLLNLKDLCKITAAFQTGVHSAKKLMRFKTEIVIESIQAANQTKDKFREV